MKQKDFFKEPKNDTEEASDSAVNRSSCVFHHKAYSMKIIKGGITQPKGFKAAGIWCGIKKTGKPDLSLIVSDVPCVAAGVFTKNSIKAAPLLVTKRHLANGTAQAVVTNSGNANCFTGKTGLTCAKTMAAETARHLGIKSDDVLVSSTGIIGRPFPIQKVNAGLHGLVAQLKASRTAGTRAARAIMTTDKSVKEIAAQFKIGSKTVTIGGCAKGSGMIEPNMATMLGFLSTDISISRPLLKKALGQAVDDSFNMITVDGCMSTNDMVVIMANGQAENSCIKTEGRSFYEFCKALTFVCQDLAKKIVLDGEGAIKILQIHVSGAPTVTAARKAAKAIANSNLVKTAAYGKNANWGRIAAAVGSLGYHVSERTLQIKTRQLARNSILIQAGLGIGTKQAKALTCDLTEEYVKINSRYN